MKAAIVHAFDQPPRYGEFEAQPAAAGEVLVRVRAAALSQLVRAQASGKHYSSPRSLPAVPGVDGVGLLEDGTRVYFAFPRAPHGAGAVRSSRADCPAQRTSSQAMPGGGAGLTDNRPRYQWPPPPEKYRSYFRPASSTAVSPPPANVSRLLVPPAEGPGERSAPPAGGTGGRAAPVLRPDGGEACRRGSRGSAVRAATLSQARPGVVTYDSR